MTKGSRVNKELGLSQERAEQKQGIEESGM